MNDDDDVMPTPGQGSHRLWLCARAVSCPICEAVPNTPCHTVGGVEMSGHHRARYTRADEERVIDRL